MVTRNAFGVVAASALFAISGGCSSSAADATDAGGGGSGSFVAYAASFSSFESWPSAPAASENDAGDGLHGVGPLRVYWNHNPPSGATSFPVGTIIVKETEGADVTQRAVFAMVKRGDGFNSAGANGWEWFSLQEASDGTVTILWRGTVAPAGETYANQAIGDCNGCHVASRNDSVWDTPLTLSSF